MPTEPADLPPAEDLPTTMTPTAHEATEQVEEAGEAKPVNDAPANDFIGTRRLTDDDTGSRMTMA